VPVYFMLQHAVRDHNSGWEDVWVGDDGLQYSGQLETRHLWHGRWVT